MVNELLVTDVARSEERVVGVHPTVGVLLLGLLLRWHRSATGQPAPVCPLTGLIWLDARQGTHFVTHAAANGMTIHQMSSARSALNWLITQHHTMRRQVNDSEPAPAKLSSKDAVRRRVVAVM